MTEPDPRRDNGPYADIVQALKQFSATTYGLPARTMTSVQMLDLVMGEALLMTEVNASDFETEYVKEFNEQNGLDPVVTQILSAWLMRAYLAGFKQGKQSWEVELGTGHVGPGEQP